VPITVLYFAAAREATGRTSEQVSPAPESVGALRRLLAERHPSLVRILPRCRIAVDQEFTPDEAPVRDGAEVALIPPVAGGVALCRVLERPLELSAVVEAVSAHERGGVVTFTGNVRSDTKGKRVLRLEYEAYVPMAERKLHAIAAGVEQETGAIVAVDHRVGVLAPGEAAVVIACSAPHRAAAFRACEAMIDRLKADVPIWKREVFEDGSVWVGLGP
jgi:molybdopterin synthase catalytic subunit